MLSRALGAAALLAAAAVATALPPAAPAQAQTATKLVGNTGQQGTGTGSFSQGDIAQAFTTGSHAGGYRLTRVDFQIRDGTTTAPTYSVRIHTESSGRPAGRISTLTNPARLPRGNNQLARFTHSGGGINLTANTTYFAVIAISNSGGGGNVDVGFTSSDDEDSGAAAGWSIANGSLWAGNISTGTWSTSTNARQIAVYGYAKTAQTPTPTRLKADTPAANMIWLTWAYGRPRPDLHVIEVSEDGGATWTQLGTATGSRYEHTGLAGGAVRHYRVKARNSVGGVNRDSAWSNVASATAVGANAPARPAGFQARAADNGVLLSWNDPNDAAVTGYEYQQAEGDTFGAWKAIPGSGPRTTSHRVTGLTAGADYTFRLRAVKGAVKGLPSGAGMARAGAVVPLPEKADLLSATASSSGSGIVTLSWNRAFVHTDGKRAYDETITKYQVEVRRRTDAGATWVDIPDSGYRTTHHFVDGLQNGVEYIFRIRAVNASGTGDPSDKEVATPTWPADMVVKHEVRLANLSITPGNGFLKVGWRKLEGRTYCGYVIGWREGGTGDWQQYAFISPLHRVKTTITGLKPGTSYQVRVSVNSGYDNVPNGVAWERTVSTTGTSGAPPITASGPALELARVRGAEMALRFDAALDESSVPAAAAFAVSVAGSAQSVSSVSVSQFLVTLTLASAVTSGQAVTVGYTPPASGKLRARGGGPAVAGFSGQAVANDTPSGQNSRQSPLEWVVGAPDNGQPAPPDAPGDEQGQPGPAAVPSDGTPGEPDAPFTLIGTNGRDDLPGSDGDDLLIGLRGADVLRGKGGHDELRGGHGHDTLLGGAGDDVLLGGKGDDELRGGRGADRLSGGDGDDTYTGGPGNDRFIFVSGDTGDKIITDFGDGGDRIVLKTEGGSWPAVADIIADVVTQGSQYYVYTLAKGLTVETDVALRARDFVVE